MKYYIWLEFSPSASIKRRPNIDQSLDQIFRRFELELPVREQLEFDDDCHSERLLIYYMSIW